jgi:hypothetical protein
MANNMKQEDVPQEDDRSASGLLLPCSDSFIVEKFGVSEGRVTVDSSLNTTLAFQWSCKVGDLKGGAAVTVSELNSTSVRSAPFQKQEGLRFGVSEK